MSLVFWIILGVIGYLIIGTLFTREVNAVTTSQDPDHKPTISSTAAIIILWPGYMLYGLVIFALVSAGVRF